MTGRVVLTGDAAAAHLAVVKERAIQWAAIVDQESKGTPDGRKTILDLSLFLVGTGQTYKVLAGMIGVTTLGGYRQGLLDAAKLRSKLPADSEIGRALAEAWADAPLRNFGTITRDLRAKALAAGLLPAAKGRKVATEAEDAESLMDTLYKRVQGYQEDGGKRAKRIVRAWNAVPILAARLAGTAPPVITFRDKVPPADVPPVKVRTVKGKSKGRKPTAPILRAVNQ